MQARKMLIALAAVLVLALLAAQCAAPATPEKVIETVVVKETVEKEVEKEVEVVVTATPATVPEGGVKVIPFLTDESDPETVEVFREVFAEYSEENPDVSIDLVLSSYASIGQRMVAAAAVGADMGVIQVDPSDMPDFIKAGYLLPLDDVVDAVGEEQFRTNVVIRGDDGHVYALGYAAGTHATLWVRTDQLKEVGLEPPTTYEEFLAAAKAMTRDLDGDGKIDIYGVGLPAGSDHATTARFITFAYQNCCDYFDKQGNLTFDQPGCLEALKRYVALLAYAPPGIAGWSTYDGIDAFIAGKVAMHPYGGRLGVNLERAAPDIRENSKVIWMPVGEKVRAGRGGYDYLAVFSGTRYPEEARAFMTFFYGGDGLARFALTVPGHLIPPTEAMTEWILLSGDEYVEKYKEDVKTMFDSVNYLAVPMINMGAINTETCEYEPTLNPMPWAGAVFSRTPPIDAEMIQRVLFSGETPEEAWEWAYTEMQKAADEWKAANPDWKPAGQ